jgi:hypothetical protein
VVTEAKKQSPTESSARALPLGDWKFALLADLPWPAGGTPVAPLEGGWPKAFFVWSN